MDFSILYYVLGSGIVAGSFGFAIGLGIRPGLKERISNLVHDLIAEEINNFVKQLHENPKFVSDLTDPLIAQVTRQFTGESPGGKSRNLNILGFKVPTEIAAPLINRFFEGKRPPRNVTPGLIDLNGE